MNHDYELELYYNVDKTEPSWFDFESAESIHTAYEELEYIKMCELQINY